MNSWAEGLHDTDVHQLAANLTRQNILTLINSLDEHNRKLSSYIKDNINLKNAAKILLLATEENIKNLITQFTPDQIIKWIQVLPEDSEQYKNFYQIVSNSLKLKEQQKNILVTEHAKEKKKKSNQAVAPYADLVASNLPEINYWMFSAVTLVIPELLKHLFHLIKKLPPTKISGPLWNYLDAICSGVTGVMQLLDTENHRQVATKLKGVVNILNTVQLTTLTAIKYAMFGGPAFAAAFGIGFALSLEDMVYAGRRMMSDDYWLEDSLAMLKKKYELIGELALELKIIKGIQGNQNNQTEQWAINQKEKRLEQLKLEKTELEKDIFAKVYADKNFYVDNFSEKYKSWIIENPQTDFEKFLAEVNTCSDKNKEYVFGSDEIKKDCIKRASNINAKNGEQFKEAFSNSVAWGAAFVGMLLICFPPASAAYTAGLLVIALASSIYLARNIYKGGKKLGFFENEDNSRKPVNKKEDKYTVTWHKGEIINHSL